MKKIKIIIGSTMTIASLVYLGTYIPRGFIIGSFILFIGVYLTLSEQTK